MFPAFEGAADQDYRSLLIVLFAPAAMEEHQHRQQSTKIGRLC
jgi:hypothetical protein